MQAVLRKSSWQDRRNRQARDGGNLALPGPSPTLDVFHGQGPMRRLSLLEATADAAAAAVAAVDDAADAEAERAAALLDALHALLRAAAAQTNPRGACKQAFYSCMFTFASRASGMCLPKSQSKIFA